MKKILSLFFIFLISFSLSADDGCTSGSECERDEAGDCKVDSSGSETTPNTTRPSDVDDA